MITFSKIGSRFRRILADLHIGPYPTSEKSKILHLGQKK